MGEYIANPKNGIIFWMCLISMLLMMGLAYQHPTPYTDTAFTLFAMLVSLGFMLKTDYFPIILYFFGLGGLLTNTLPPPLCVGLVGVMVFVVIYAAYEQLTHRDCEPMLKAFDWEFSGKDSEYYMWTRDKAKLSITSTGLCFVESPSFYGVYYEFDTKVLTEIHHYCFIKPLQHENLQRAAKQNIQVPFSGDGTIKRGHSGKSYASGNTTYD